MPLQLGTSLGPYQIDAPLGAGGMGEVYQATDTRLDRTVAIKVLPEHVAADPDLKQRFEREARTVAALNHPHICTLYDIGNQDGIDFLVMEYLDGETLAQRLEKGALPLDQALTIAIEIADALDKAHRQGIVHRDIKPSNVMLAESGAQLLDFGIAVRFSGAELETVTRSTVVVAEIGGVAGTLPYMAPEVLRGELVDERSDIWSLGVLLYETVTGVRPFGGKSGVDVTSAILRDQPKTFSHAVPGPLQGIVRRCLAKEPDRRYQRAGELRAALEPVEATASDRVTTVPGTGAGQPTSPEAITGSRRPPRSLTARYSSARGGWDGCSSCRPLCRGWAAVTLSRLSRFDRSATDQLGCGAAVREHLWRFRPGVLRRRDDGSSHHEPREH